MKRIMLIFGTRPEAIKMCPLVCELKKHADKFETLVCVTGQHREMLDQVLEVFHVIPDYDLSIMKKGQDLFDITNVILSKLQNLLEETKPDLVLVHGDTTTSFASGLAAFYKKIPVGHVEAGLRTNNLYSPWPEEFNRQAVDIFSELYFAPTRNSKDNLLKEGKCNEKVFVTGNTSIDALRYTVKKSYKNSILEWVGADKFILLTAHRRENLGKPLINIFNAVRELLEKYEDLKVIYPIHMNPEIRKSAEKILGGVDRVKIIPPLDVIAFHNLMGKSYLIMTDSGGVQEEAPSLGKPVLVLRDTTERPEGVAAGTLKVVGTSVECIVDSVASLIENSAEYMKMAEAKNPYGDGFASFKIVKIIEEYFDKNK